MAAAYRQPDHAGTVDVDTPFGVPSAPPAVGEIGGPTVAFLPRHGTDDRYPEDFQTTVARFVLAVEADRPQVGASL